TLIVRDLNITNGAEEIPIRTTNLRIGNCRELHLSGSTLLNLTNLQSLELHSIRNINVDVHFFMQYNTPV
ncbi:hypothetical protein SK128_024254, partial [Halocaridina rubra]